MKRRINACAVPILSSYFLVSVLAAQTPREHGLPLKNWPAPLYWQPTPAETETIGLRPEIRTPTLEAATPVGSLVFVAMAPCRVVDTRAGSGFPAQFGPPSLSPFPAIRTFPIQLSTNCSVPNVAQAYSFNVTVIPNPLGSSVGYLTLYPTAASPNTPPNAVTLDDITGDIRNNAAIVPAGISNGSVSAVTNGSNPDLVIDINGYYAPSTGITLAQGTAAAPSLSFSGDAGTGIFSTGTGTLNLATGGTNRLTVRSDGDLDLMGNIRQGGVLFLQNRGTNSTGLGLNALGSSTGQNTGVGHFALSNTTSGNYNTGVGTSALTRNIGGNNNTAIGDAAMFYNTGGNDNTAVGLSALVNNTTGAYNSATGSTALAGNTTGFGNVATGYQALLNNTIGAYNTAVGFQALNKNTTGNGNVATGDFALSSNTSGIVNTASGENALINNTTGNNNTGMGHWALQNNTTGSTNTGVGVAALLSNVSGSTNTALGYFAGSNITGSNNIAIGSAGAAAENGVIRIGESGTHTAFFAAGVHGVTTGTNDAVSVMIDSNGQLGTVNSSRRYKEDIQDMSDASSGLLRLRPVTYRYQQPYAEGSKPLDYGLIAEEVAEVYPDLVVKNADGQIETVQYHKLTPMLLNEVQRLHAQLSELKKALSALLPDKLPSAAGIFQ